MTGMSLDVNEIRDLTIASHGIANADRAYVMYYDETNNIRRLHVRSDGLNFPNPQCFVVGGIAHASPVRSLELEELRTSLRVQKSATEIKLKHIAKGEFLDLIKDAKMEVFLSWIMDKGYFVHYSVLDPLYWSIVDVVDSILAEYGEAELFMHHMRLKNDLYTLLRNNYAQTVDLFQRYSYPDVGRDRRPVFVSELLMLLETRRGLFEPFNFMMLKSVLQAAMKLERLPFLEDVEPNVLIESFGPVFVERICLLKNSSHIFDVEDVIREHLAGIDFRDGEKLISNFRFAVSHDETGVQLSDVVTGLVGKFFSYVCSTDLKGIVRARGGLSEQQRRSLRLFSDLFDRSTSENRAFAHSILSIADQQKAAILLE